MTTGISLVRENTVSMQPPRSLWVSFPLGRPLGKPGDPQFQHEVIRAALALLHRTAPPVLEDFPRDVPAPQAHEQAPACPVSFAAHADQTQTWSQRLAADLASVKPWYELSLRRRQRTLVGVSDASPEENMAALGELLDAQRLPTDNLSWFKHAVEDLKVLYLEALTAQPGNYDQQAVQRLLWQQSALGAALLRFHDLFAGSEQPGIRIIARMIASREAVELARAQESN